MDGLIYGPSIGGPELYAPAFSFGTFEHRTRFTGFCREVQ